MNKHHKHKKITGKRRARPRFGLSPEQLAEALGIGRNQTYEALRNGTIPALRIGRMWLIADATLEAIKNGTLVNNEVRAPSLSSLIRPAIPPPAE